jgi:hypothetical protein
MGNELSLEFAPKYTPLEVMVIVAIVTNILLLVFFKI